MVDLRGGAADSRVILSVEETDTEVRITLGGDLFPSGATAVTGEAAVEIRGLGLLLDGPLGGRVLVEGHTDSTGTAETNRRVSRLRAEGVAALLMEGGLPEVRLTALGRGEENPVANNDTPAGRARNRRVEIRVQKSG
jgi:outer membrane protein OmpA-like peptidoglycan-associated protein